MNVFHLLRSEWTKLVSTKAIYWTTFIFIVMAVGFAALVGTQVEPDPALFNVPILYANSTVGVIASLGLFVVSIQAIMVVTSEYRYNYQTVTFMATPNRPIIAVTKLFLYGVFAAIMTFVVVLGCFYMAKFTATAEASATLQVWEDDNALRIMWTYPLTMFLLIAFSQGVAWLLRQTAGAVALMSLWILALENILRLVPRIGEKIYTYGPMSNMSAFMLKTPIPDAPWSFNGSGLYFGIWALVVLVGGIVVLRMRDA